MNQTMTSSKVNKSQAIMGMALFAAVSLSGWQFYKNDDQKMKNEFKANISDAEIRLLQQELASVRHELIEEKAKPSYDEGYRSCILHMGGAQQTGSYKDGFEAALKLVNNASYADGYHAAIEQFGYQSQGKQIVPKPNSDNQKNNSESAKK